MARHATGDRVMHAQYGDGTITETNEYHTRIEFDAHGLHTFSSPRMSLAPSSTPAPPKATRRARKPRVVAAAVAPTAVAE